MSVAVFKLFTMKGRMAQMIPGFCKNPSFHQFSGKLAYIAQLTCLLKGGVMWSVLRVVSVCVRGNLLLSSIVSLRHGVLPP